VAPRLIRVPFARFTGYRAFTIWRFLLNRVMISSVFGISAAGLSGAVKPSKNDALPSV